MKNTIRVWNFFKLLRQELKTPPDWSLIGHMLETGPDQLEEVPFDLTYCNVAVRETDLRIRLMDISRDHPELNIILDPIPEGTVSVPYTFSYQPFGILRAGIEDPQYRTCTDYGPIVLLGGPEGTPVLIESIQSQWRHNRKVVRNGRSLNEIGGVMGAMMPEQYNPHLHPLRTHYDEDVGHILIVPQDIWIARERKKLRGTTYAQFKRAGGMVAGYYTTRRRFIRDLIEHTEDGTLPFTLP